jgi:HTH-type transcriptional regulator/antitoxin HipB
MFKIHEQIRVRRKSFGIRQKDMEHFIGMKQAQYQKIEAGGNAGLRTLERVLKVLKFQIVLVPEEKLDFVLSLLEEDKKESKAGQELSLFERFQVVDDE